MKLGRMALYIQHPDGDTWRFQTEVSAELLADVKALQSYLAMLINEYAGQIKDKPEAKRSERQ